MTRTSGRSEIILVVEDDENIRQSLFDLFELERYRVIAVPNGAEALEQLKKTQPDLVILDITMPIMDGIEFKKIMDSQTGSKDIPVIVFTGYPKRVPPNMGAAQVIDKCASPDKILSAVRLHLSLRK